MERDKDFSGGIPDLYDRVLVPLIFEQYAADIANRVAAFRPKRVLEIAAGTGAVTRELALRLPTGCEIIATDLNQPMLDVAQRKGAAGKVVWKLADAMQLPFPDAAFDAVVCQFGAMFFPNRAHAYGEARRVLKDGGAFVFNVWDRIDDNEFANVVEDTLANIFPENAPRFMSRTPHGYHDGTAIERDLRLAGFNNAPRIETVTKVSRASSARVAAIAYCQGTPLRNEIEARDAKRLAEVTDASEQALLRRFGSGEIEGKIQAVVISVSK